MGDLGTIEIIGIICGGIVALGTIVGGFIMLGVKLGSLGEKLDIVIGLVPTVHKLELDMVKNNENTEHALELAGENRQSLETVCGRVSNLEGVLHGAK